MQFYQVFKTTTIAIFHASGAKTKSSWLNMIKARLQNIVNRSNVFVTIVALVAICFVSSMLKILQQPFELVTYFSPGPELLNDWWRLLLPVPSPEHERWSTSGLVLVWILDRILSPAGTFHFLSAVLIVTSFYCSWLAYRSKLFSYTMALCMAFGTQFNYAYINTSLVKDYLMTIYALINLKKWNF